jgi:apurinic endonuclease APN1
MVRSDIGAHASIKDGILEGIKYIEKIGGNVIQIFLGSNQSASLKNKRSINIEEANAIRKYLKLNQLKLFIHAVYILNLSSFTASSQRIEYARQNLLYDLKKGTEIGAKGVVVHLGYRKTLTDQEAYFNMADNVVKVVVDLLKFQDQSKEKSIKDSRIKLILETPAGAGTQIGTTLEDLDKLWNIIKELSKKYQSQHTFILNYKKILDRIGFCIDTAHIFSSGNPVTNPATMVTYLEKFIKTFGKSKLTCFHINDSKAPFNSRRDLHHGLGQGHLFKDNMDTLKEVWKFSTKYNIPMILETHGSGFYDTQKDKGLYQVEINLFREWDMKKRDHNPVPEFLESYQRVFDPKILKSINNKRSLSKKSKKKENSKKGSNKSRKSIQSKQSKKKVSRLGNHYTLYNNNKLIVDTLNRVKQYYQLISDRIHIIAYQKAIYQLKRYPYNIESGNQIAHLPGIGKGMITKIDTIITTGKLPFLSQKSVSAKLKKKDSIDYKVDELIEIPGIGEKKAMELIKLGFDTINKLKQGVKQDKIKLTICN